METLCYLIICLIVFRLAKCCSHFSHCVPITAQGSEASPSFTETSIVNYTYFTQLEVRLYGDNELRNAVVDIKLCSGTLVRPNFVMTSAECFTFDNKRIAREVKLVYYTIEGNAISENDLLLSPAEIYVHEKRIQFTNLDAYGYEIALLQLPPNIITQSNMVNIELPSEAQTRNVLTNKTVLKYAGYLKNLEKITQQGPFGVVEMVLQENDVCREKMEFRRKEWLRGYDLSILCAFTPDSNGSMATPIDIGAGLIELQEGSDPVIHGVLSTPVFSRLNINQTKEIDPEAPTYFNRVSYSRMWINELLEPQNAPPMDRKARRLI